MFSGSRDREKSRKIVAKVHKRVAFRRSGFACWKSVKIMPQDGRIFAEEAHVNEKNDVDV